jgi:hypothetical protein
MALTMSLLGPTFSERMARLGNWFTTPLRDEIELERQP